MGSLILPGYGDPVLLGSMCHTSFSFVFLPPVSLRQRKENEGGEKEFGGAGPSARLTPRVHLRFKPLPLPKPMGKQYNKGIKKKRRIAYHKRKKAAAGKTAKAKK